MPDRVAGGSGGERSGAGRARPGVVVGARPERADDTPGPRRSGWGRASRRGARACIARARELSPSLAALDRSALVASASALRAELARSAPPADALAQAFALGAAASQRALSVEPYDVQLEAAYWMAHGRVVELETGEGKTLALALAASLAALAGVPVHVVSANDYLAARDAAALEPLYDALGLRSGALAESDASTDAARRADAYHRDVVYGTTRSFGFDYLRDVLAAAGGADEPEPAFRQRGLCLALVDEADSVLIDQAEMPLVLATEVDGAPERRMRRRALRLARGLEPGRHFEVDREGRRAALSGAGRAELVALSKPFGPEWSGPRRRERWVEQALQALYAYRRDHDYVVRDGAVVVVDPSTGRAARDRSWERGLQQWIEQKEGLPPSPEHETLARISVQRFYGRYLELAGATGTACEAARELRAAYGLRTRRIAPRLPSQRTDLGLSVHAEARGKWAHVVERVRVLRAEGRPVLVGTGSVAASRHVSTLLRGSAIPHRVLDARQDRAEAEVVAAAGEVGRVTVATQMAGRGTDIVLAPESRLRGGLHVIATEWGDAGRIERQLIGRAARQGDPGSFERIHSLDDDAVRSRAPGWAITLAGRAARRTPGSIVPREWGNLLTWWVRSAEEAERRRRRRQLVTLEEELGQLLAFAGRGE